MPFWVSMIRVLCFASDHAHFLLTSVPLFYVYFKSPLLEGLESLALQCSIHCHLPIFGAGLTVCPLNMCSNTPQFWG